jgi:hypothetical protein
MGMDAILKQNQVRIRHFAVASVLSLGDQSAAAKRQVGA